MFQIVLTVKTHIGRNGRLPAAVFQNYGVPETTGRTKVIRIIPKINGHGTSGILGYALSQLGNIIGILFRLFLIGHKGTVYLGTLDRIIVNSSYGLLGGTEIIINDICLMIGLRDKDILRIIIQYGIRPHGRCYHKGCHHSDKDQ